MVETIGYYGIMENSKMDVKFIRFLEKDRGSIDGNLLYDMIIRLGREKLLKSISLIRYTNHKYE